MPSTKPATTATQDDISTGEVFRRTSFSDKAMSSCSQAGMVNNLNDGLAWGLLPIFFADAGLSVSRIGVLAALYPAVWGLGQLVTGGLSDRIGRKPLIVGGMLTQAAAIGWIAATTGFAPWALGAIGLGAGTAMVYPTLIAAIGDVAHPSWRARSVGVYRLWRDGGFAVGALLAGVLADSFSITAAIWAVAGLTAAVGDRGAGAHVRDPPRGVDAQRGVTSTPVRSRSRAANASPAITQGCPSRPVDRAGGHPPGHLDEGPHAHHALVPRQRRSVDGAAGCSFVGTDEAARQGPARRGDDRAQGSGDDEGRGGHHQRGEPEVVGAGRQHGGGPVQHRRRAPVVDEQVERVHVAVAHHDGFGLGSVGLQPRGGGGEIGTVERVGGGAQRLEHRVQPRACDPRRVEAVLDRGRVEAVQLGEDRGERDRESAGERREASPGPGCRRGRRGADGPRRGS